MQEIAYHSTVQDGTARIELRFKSLEQLFDEADTSPAPARELSVFAEEAIAGYTDEYPLRLPVDLTIALPARQMTSRTEHDLAAAVHRHFAFRIPQLEHTHRLSFRYGKRSLLVAIANALVAIPFLYFTYQRISEPFYYILLFGLVMILNWVTIWDTYEYFVYEYRKQTHTLKLYRKVAALPVRVVPYG
jgi:hypothetical protein